MAILPKLEGLKLKLNINFIYKNEYQKTCERIAIRISIKNLTFCLEYIYIYYKMD